MKSIMTIFCAGLLLTVVSTLHLGGQENSSQASAGWQQMIDEAGFSGVVLAAEDGQILFQSATGMADSQDQVPIRNHTKFRIASITKSITALLVMQLVEEGRVDPEQSIDALLPDISLAACKNITVHHLLMHTSGLQQEPDSIYSKPMSPRELIHQLIEGKKPAGELGRFHYNNLDYVLLGLIIERLRGQPFETVVRERIIEPLDLKNTGFLKRGEWPEGLATGYVCEADSCREEPDYYIENFYAAGAMYSTAEDLLKWDQALYGTELLSAAGREIMYRSDPNLGYVAYGSWTYRYPFVAGQPFTVERRGGILGFNSVIMRFPEARKTLIMLSNTDRFNPDSFGNPENPTERLVHLLFAGQ